jgi:hypothetical protein
MCTIKNAIISRIWYTHPINCCSKVWCEITRTLNIKLTNRKYLRQLTCKEAELDKWRAPRWLPASSGLSPCTPPPLHVAGAGPVARHERAGERELVGDGWCLRAAWTGRWARACWRRVVPAPMPFDGVHLAWRRLVCGGRGARLIWS